MIEKEVTVEGVVLRKLNYDKTSHLGTYELIDRKGRSIQIKLGFDDIEEVRTLVEEAALRLDLTENQIGEFTKEIRKMAKEMDSVASQ
ncbi:hypothetical protein HZC08_01585 [Candidatus Micrarchaeota archaeon]|nr:hypothetical protein [Candidatus Micrarchaeota archaeon]